MMIDPKILSYFARITPEEELLLSGSEDIDRERYMKGSSDVIDAGKLLSSGQLITIRPHTRFVRFPEHTHNYIEMVYMCKGKTEHIAGGTHITLKEGELLLLGPGASQEILPAGRDDIAVNFIILPQFFDRTLEMLGEDETSLRRFIVNSLGVSSGEPSASNYLYFQVSDVLPVQNLIENLLWALINRTPNRRLIDQTTMGLLFMQLINHADRLYAASPEESDILRVLRYVEENYKDASLTELASLLHYDVYTLSRKIKKHTDRTFKELLQEKRLSRAAYLLRHTDLKVDSVGEAVGYTNLSYFHRIFRQRFSVTPHNFRRSADQS